MGALLALWLIRTTQDTIGKRTSLYINNQSIITAINSPQATSGQYLLSSAKIAANNSGTSLTIRWISSHSDVKGNEEVDKLAKEAVEGRSSAADRLPHLLRSPLPTSDSALKQEYNMKLRMKWLDTWNTLPRK